MFVVDAKTIQAVDRGALDLLDKQLLTVDAKDIERIHGKQGETKSTVTIFTNDPTQPSGSKMELTAFVKRAIMIEPMGGVVFRTLDPNFDGESRCRLINQDDKPMHPEIVVSGLTKFDAKIEAAMAESARAIERALDSFLPVSEGSEVRLIEAMRYAALGGGKRFRPFLVMQSAGLFGVDPARLRPSWAYEIKWSDRYVDQPQELVGLVECARRNANRLCQSVHRPGRGSRRLRSTA